MHRVCHPFWYVQGTECSERLTERTSLAIAVVIAAAAVAAVATVVVAAFFRQMNKFSIQ